MKVNRTRTNIASSQVAIVSATVPGTAYYRITEEDLIRILQKHNVNIWIQYMIETKGLSAINFNDMLFGSAIIDGVLYLCKSDGQPIQVNGEEVDPDDALSNYDVSDLDTYIKDPTDTKMIARSITEYEIHWPNLDDIAQDAINAGYKFTELVKATNELRDVIDSI